MRLTCRQAVAGLWSGENPNHHRNPITPPAYTSWQFSVGVAQKQEARSMLPKEQNDRLGLAAIGQPALRTTTAVYSLSRATLRFSKGRFCDHQPRPARA